MIGFVFWYGIEKIFLHDNLAIGPTGISIIVTLYLAITLALDIPASVIADRWGRRNMLIVSLFCFIAADIILGLSQNFAMYLLGTVLWGFFIVSSEGTFEAILYDSLKEQRREKNFQKIDARARMMFMIGVAISSMMSGWIADELGLRGAYFLSVVPLIIALIIVWYFMAEPLTVTDDEVEEVKELGYIGHFKHATNIVVRSPQLRLIALGTVILFFIQTPLYEFEQYIFINLFPSTFLVGLVNGLAGWLLALGFYVATKKVFRPNILLVISGLALTCIGILANLGALVPLAVVLLVASILENSLQTDLQHATSSKTRATVTSMVYFSGSVLIVPFVFLFGWLAEERSIWLAYFVNGIVVLLLGAVYFAQNRRVKIAK